jgi:hypothetical protein
MICKADVDYFKVLTYYIANIWGLGKTAIHLGHKGFRPKMESRIPRIGSRNTDRELRRTVLCPIIFNSASAVEVTQL